MAALEAGEPDAGGALDGQNAVKMSKPNWSFRLKRHIEVSVARCKCKWPRFVPLAMAPGGVPSRAARLGGETL